MNNINISLIIDSRKLAREAHKSIVINTVSGDIRPQFEHLQEVADLVWISGGSDIEIASAWLHDCVEDTSVTISDIKNKFGSDVADIVAELTDPDEFSGLSNAERKPKQAQRIKNKSGSAKRIKLADQISNIRFVATDPRPNWSVESNRYYMIGAKLIVDECKGISAVLDTLFENEYKKAAKIFNINL